jgi:hypothetical protein
MGSADPTADASADLLAQHFSGKRSAERLICSREVWLVGAEGRFRARTLDLSEGGALVELLDEAFTSTDRAGHAADCFALAAQNFSSGVRLEFPADAEGRRGLTLDAEVVRLTVGPDPKDGVRAGCRFARPLSAEESAFLGMAAPIEGAEILVPRNGVTAFAFLFAPGHGTVGPLVIAPLLRIYGNRLGGRACVGGDVTRFAAALRAGNLHLACHVSGRRVWDTHARVLAARPSPLSALDLEIDIAADEVPPRAVRRHYRADRS